MDQRYVVVVAEERDDLVRLRCPHQAGIDKDAGELVANRFVEEDSGDRGIDAARQSADHLALADLQTNLLDLGLAERAHVPGRNDVRDLGDEVRDHPRAVRGVHDFGVELNAVELALFVGDHGVRRIVRRCEHVEAWRDGGDLVAMVHPDRLGVARPRDTVEQKRILRHEDVGAAELAVMAGLDPAAELLAHRHLAIADPEHWNAERKNLLRRARRMRLGDAGRTAGEDDRFWRGFGERFLRLVVSHDLAIDPCFAHAPRDQLGDLRTEIDDEDGSCHDGIYGLPPLLVQRSNVATKKPSVAVVCGEARKKRAMPWGTALLIDSRQTSAHGRTEKSAWRDRNASSRSSFSQGSSEQDA